MVRGLLEFSDLCFEEKSGNIEFGFEFELDLQLDSKLDLEFEFHIFHSDSHELCVSLYMGNDLLNGQFRLTNSQWKKESYIVETYISAL